MECGQKIEIKTKADEDLYSLSGMCEKCRDVVYFESLETPKAKIDYLMNRFDFLNKRLEELVKKTGGK